MVLLPADIEGKFIVGDIGDLDLILCLEVVDELLDSEGSLDFKLVPGCPVLWDGNGLGEEDRIHFLVLSLGGWEWFGEEPEWEGEVDEAVLHLGEWLLEEGLDDLESDGSDDHGRGGGEGGNDFSGDQFDLEIIDLLDGVVSGSEVSDRPDEFDVPVGWVILLELDGSELSTGIGGNSLVLELLDKLGTDWFVILSLLDGGVLLISLDGYLLGLEGFDVDTAQYGFNLVEVIAVVQTKHESVDVGC